MKITIKKEYRSTVVGFNNSAKPLGDRNDLYLLAEIAHKSQSKTLKKYFTKLPSLKSIQDYKGKIFLDEMNIPHKEAPIKVKENLPDA